MKSLAKQTMITDTSKVTDGLNCKDMSIPKEAGEGTKKADTSQTKADTSQTKVEEESTSNTLLPYDFDPDFIRYLSLVLLEEFGSAPEPKVYHTITPPTIPLDRIY